MIFGQPHSATITNYGRAGVPEQLAEQVEVVALDLAEEGHRLNQVQEVLLVQVPQRRVEALHRRGFARLDLALVQHHQLARLHGLRHVR